MISDLERCCSPEELAHYASLGLLPASAQTVEHINNRREQYEGEAKTAYDSGWDEGKRYILTELQDDMTFGRLCDLEQALKRIKKELDGLS